MEKKKNDSDIEYVIVLIDRFWDYYGNKTIPEIDLNKVTICKSIKLYDKMVDYDLIKVWHELKVKPLVIVFDLDLTLWPFWIDSNCDPPFSKVRDCQNDECHTIVDRKNRVFTFYTNVPKILNTLRNYCLKDNGYMAIASRTSASNDALQLIELYGWKNHFNSFQIYSTQKMKHMDEICKELNIRNKKDILFFDDDIRNINDTSPLGLTAYLLDYRNGLTLKDCINGLLAHQSKYELT